MSESVSVTRSPSVSLIVTKTDDFSLANNSRLKFHILGQTMISSHVQSTRHLKHQDKTLTFNKDQEFQTKNHCQVWICFRFFSERGGLCFLITPQLRCQCRIAERQDKGWGGFCGLLTVQGTVTSLSDTAQKR